MKETIAVLLVALLAIPAYASAATTDVNRVGDEVLDLFVVFDGAFAIRVPHKGMTWTVGAEDAQPTARIYHPSGEVFAAVRPGTSFATEGRLAELPRDYFDKEHVETASTDAAACDTGSLGMYVCADITYNGGSSPIWHHGSVENVPSNHQCLSGTGCLRIQGCTHVSCPNEAWFWVQPDATYASACWTWRAWTYVNARATYAGVSPATGDVFPSWWTTC